jgi:hypothetical protein
MTTLFTYTITHDDGAAPNPFHGVCTLAICKPSIRRVAAPGDWVVGLGSRNAPGGDLSGKVVYAMRVESSVSFRDYDKIANKKWPGKVPDVTSLDLSKRLGDCIYDFSSGQPVQRPGVHGPQDQKKDLSGRNVLMSKHFFYFGGRALPLPEHLLGLCHQTQGHRSRMNDPYVSDFIEWIHGGSLRPGQLYGWPDYLLDWEQIQKTGCRERDDDQDEGSCG